MIPTYQRRDVVARAVRSVLAQSYRDFELIVVDDAWLPDHLAAVTETFARQPGAVLVSTSPRHRAEGRAAPEDAVLFEPLPACLYGNPVGWPSSIAARRADLEAVGGFDEQLPVGEGGELWARLAFRGPFGLLQRRTLDKRHTADGLVEQWRDSGAFLDAFEVTARRGAERVETLPGSAAGRLRPLAAGAIAFVAALRALVRRDEASAVAGLEEACRLAGRPVSPALVPSASTT